MNLQKKLLVLALASAFAQSAQAATFTWDCAGSNFWDIQSCWGPNGLPGSADIVQINTPHRVSIDAFTGTALASQLYVSGSGEIRQLGGALAVALEYLGSGSVGFHSLLGGTHSVSSALFVGHAGGEGYYTQTGGTLNANTVVIGEGVSRGVTSITNGSWNVTNNVTVGSTSASGWGGQLSVGSGGNVTIGGALTVNRPSGSSTKVGAVSTSGGGVIKVGGTMTLAGGTVSNYWGAVDSAGAIFANDMLTANGVTVGGTGSLWSTSVLIAGRNGPGTLGINANGKVTANTGYIAEFTSSTGNIVMNGSNAQLQVSGGLYVGGNASGSGGIGTLTVNSGGTATAGSLTVWNGASSIKTGTTASSTGGIIDIASALTLQGGGDATSYNGFVDGTYGGSSSGIYAGSVSISGTGSRWDTAIHYTGYSGTGITTVGAGGTLTSIFSTHVGTTSGSNGTLNVTAGGSVLTNSNGYLGFSPGATGTATVGGAGALWDVAGGLYVGGNGVASAGTGTLDVTSGGTVQAGSLTVWNGASSIKTGTTASSTGGTIDIAGELKLSGGAKATSYFGFVDGSYAGTGGIDAYSATISGTGSRWDTAIHQTGVTGTGITTVENGGTVKSTLRTIVGNVSGSNGTLNINAGGLVDTDGDGFLGLNPGATGSATVGGAGALWDVAGGLFVGGSNGVNGGTGILTVNSGGTVKAGFTQIRQTGTLNLSGGSISTASLLSTGTINVLGGVSTLQSLDSSGSLNVSGATLLLNSGATYGLGGQTSITPQGKIQAAGSATIVNLSGTVSNGGTLNANTGAAINLTGGILYNGITTATAASSVSIQSGATLQGGFAEASGSGSMIDVQTGGAVNNAILQAFNGANLNINGTVNGGSVRAIYGGTLTGSGTIYADVFNSNGGSVGPGNSPGVMTIAGDFTQDAFSSLMIQIGGLTAGTEYDVLNVSGTAYLAGTLDVEYWNGFGASLGESFDIVTASTLSGTFDTMYLASLGQGLAWQVDYLTDAYGSTDVVRLSVQAVPEAETWIMMLAGLGLVGTMARRRRPTHV